MGRGGRGRIGEGGLERGEGQCIARKGIMAHRRCQERLTDRKLNVIRRMGGGGGGGGKKQNNG